VLPKSLTLPAVVAAVAVTFMHLRQEPMATVRSHADWREQPRQKVAPVLSMPQDLSPTWPSSTATMPLQTLRVPKGTNTASHSLGLQARPLFLALSCGYHASTAFFLFPPLSYSLACLPAMPLFALGKWSPLLPTLSLSPWPTGIMEALTPKSHSLLPGKFSLGLPASGCHPSLMGLLGLDTRF
jgi:hypothetical protein